MTAEIGNFALILALAAALWQAAFPFVGAVRNDNALAASAPNVIWHRPRSKPPLSPCPPTATNAWLMPSGFI